MIPRSAITPAPARVETQHRKLDAIRDAVEEGLGLKAPQQDRYSVADIKAWQIGAPIHSDVAGKLGAEHPATVHLHSMLRELSQGCHRYDGPDKLVAYRGARDHASAAVCELLIGGHSAPARQIEQELMPALAGLLRRIERKRAARW